MVSIDSVLKKNNERLTLGLAWAVRLRLLVLGSFLLFWAVSLWNLDRLPAIHNDEPAVLAPGYKLFRQGVYGSDLYTGFFGQEQLYLETMPLMPLLQGLSSHLFGVHVWSMRFFPVALGMLTLALTFTVAKQVVSKEVGLLAVGLLMLWLWSPVSRASGSGIPLIDGSRVARYDVLVPPLSLAAFYAWLTARRTGQLIFDGVSGLLVGLAALANVYGIFWLPILASLTLLDGWRRTDRRVWLRVAWFGLAAIAVISIWGVVIATHWADFLGQFRKHEGRFSLLSPMFYLNNLLAEPDRYQLGLEDPSTLGRFGFWLTVVALPLSLAWLGRQAWLGRRRALWLLLPCLAFPLLFALLINKKKFEYFLVIMPFFSMAVAWGWVWLLHHRQSWLRWLAAVLIGLLIGQGGYALMRMQQTALLRPRPASFFAELQTIVPASARVVGPPQYWLALHDRVYRDFGLAFIQVQSDGSNPAAFEAVLYQIAPQFVLMTPTTTDWLAEVDRLQPIEPSRQAQFQAFMQSHQAELIDQLIDSRGEPVHVYHLKWPSD